LKDAHKAQDLATIDSAMTEVNTAFQAASQEMYNAQAQSGGGAGAAGDPFSNFAGGDPFGGNGAPNNGGGNSGNSGNAKEGGVTDVDFEEVK